MRRVATIVATVLGVLATCGAAWAGGSANSKPVSRPAYVTPACRAPGNAPACAVALRYLAALDLDRAREACGLLEPSTLEAAGGMRGCVKILSSAHGIRIRYGIHGVGPSPLGRTIRFWTKGRSDTPVRQQMLVSPAGRIVAIVPEP
jgi:hypothetical protein